MPSKKGDEKYKMRLKNFEISTINPDSTVVFIGKRRSGKSFTLRDLLYNLKDKLPKGTVVSGTEDASPFFSHFVPDSYIHTEYDSQITAKILKVQRKKSKKARAMGKDPKELHEYNHFYILDDCLYDKTWTKSTEIRNIFMNGRHFNIFFIITMQYPLGIPPNLRSNIDYSFIFQDHNAENRDRIYNSFAGAVGNKAIFMQLMNNLKKHECLVIDNSSSSPNIEDRVFIYKAKDNGPFKIGSASYWQAHYKFKKASEEKKRAQGFESDSDNDTNSRRTVNEYRPKRAAIDLEITRGDEYYRR